LTGSQGTRAAQGLYRNDLPDDLPFLSHIWRKRTGYPEVTPHGVLYPKLF